MFHAPEHVRDACLIAFGIGVSDAFTMPLARELVNSTNRFALFGLFVCVSMLVFANLMAIAVIWNIWRSK